MALAGCVDIEGLNQCLPPPTLGSSHSQLCGVKVLVREEGPGRPAAYAAPAKAWMGSRRDPSCAQPHHGLAHLAHR